MILPFYAQLLWWIKTNITWLQASTAPEAIYLYVRRILIRSLCRSPFLSSAIVIPLVLVLRPSVENHSTTVRYLPWFRLEQDLTRNPLKWLAQNVLYEIRFPLPYFIIPYSFTFYLYKFSRLLHILEDSDIHKILQCWNTGRWSHIHSTDRFRIHQHLH